MYVLRDHPFRHPINTQLFNPDMSYEFSLAGLYPDASHHPFYDGPGLHHHYVMLEWDLPLEPILSFSSGLSAEDRQTTSVSGPVCKD
ncbi:hypothetical protein AHAS_Ahas01G0114300 [Arachis hypogaea]